jgi:hypothetical protein
MAEHKSLGYPGPTVEKLIDHLRKIHMFFKFKEPDFTNFNTAIAMLKKIIKNIIH